MFTTPLGTHLVGSKADNRLRLSEDDLKLLALKYGGEIEEALQDRSQQELEWNEILDRYEMKRRSKPRERWHPNFFVPLMQTDVESAFTNMFSSLVDADPICSIKTEDKRVADILENYLTQRVSRTMSFILGLSDTILTSAKLGNFVWKCPYTKAFRNKLTYVEGQGYENNVKLTYEGPYPRAVDPRNFIMPCGEVDPQTARWVAECYEVSWGELSLLASQDYFDISEIRNYKNENDLYDILEICAYESLTDDELEADIHFYMEKRSKRILRAQVSIYDGYRAYISGIYFPNEFSNFGTGVAKMDLELNDEINIIHNETLLNTMIANSKVFREIIRPGVKRERSIEIYPGKRLYVKSPDDITPMDMGSPGAAQSGLMLQSYVLDLSHRRSGITPLSQGIGDPTVGSRSTATSTISLLRRSAAKQELPLLFYKLGLAQLFKIYLLEIKQFEPKGFYDSLKPEDVALVKTFLRDVNIDDLGISINAISGDTKEVRQRSLLELAEPVHLYYTEKLALVERYENPQTGSLTKSAAKLISKAADEGLRALLSTSDAVYNVEDYIITWEEIESGRETEEPPLGVEELTGMEGFGEFTREPGAGVDLGAMLEGLAGGAALPPGEAGTVEGSAAPTL